MTVPPPPGRRTTIIFNPVAGSRRRTLLNRTVAALHRHGWDVTVTGTTGPASATNLAARAALAGQDLIVAAGGDGTIGEVVAGMADSGIPLGIIPMGTANVLAAELGLPRRAEAIAGSFDAGARRRLHVPEIEDRPFLLMAGAGFDGAVVRTVGPALKRGLGKGAFLLRGLQAFARGPAADIAVEIDGTAHRAEWVVVTNISRYGGAYRLVPHADPGRPELTVVLFRRAGRVALARHLMRLGLGILESSRDVEFVAARHVTLSDPTPPAAPLQVDGDAAGTLPCRISATDRFLEIVVPP